MYTCITLIPQYGVLSKTLTKNRSCLCSITKNCLSKERIQKLAKAAAALLAKDVLGNPHAVEFDTVGHEKSFQN